MRDIMKRLEAVLKEAGFSVDAHTPAESSITLSASKGEMRAVLHIAERMEVPHRAVALAVVPRKGVTLKAGIPGLIPPTANAQHPNIMGAGSAGPAKRESGHAKTTSDQSQE